MARLGWPAALLALPFWMGGCPPTPGTDAPAFVTVVHASPDAPLVDVCLGGEELFIDLDYAQATEYAEVDAGVHPFKLIPARAGCGSAGLFAANLDLPGYTDTTVVVLDYANRLDVIALDDVNTAPPAGFARVRFVHAGADSPFVDITLATGTPLFEDVGFKQVGDYIEIEAGTYDLDVRDITATSLLLPVDGVTFNDGAVYTLYLIGLRGGSPALDVLITQER